MAVTVDQLATRILGRLGVLDGSETPDAADLVKAREKLLAAHAFFLAEDLLRWTLLDIPNTAEEPYVLCGASLACDDFQRPPRPEWFAQGLAMIQSSVHVRIEDPGTAECF